jgi:hypothetical protein
MVDLLLTMSIPGRNSTAATLVRTGFVVVLVLVNVSGFRPVLARGWPGAGPTAWELDCHALADQHAAGILGCPRAPVRYRS